MLKSTLTRCLTVGLILFLTSAAANAATITLGSFSFDSNLFGNTLGESDGGTFRNSNWLNVLNANPGNPGALTGANFDTGVANIGFTTPIPTYTIGYTTAIANGAGADLGIVSARFSLDDTFFVAVSMDGVTFSSTIAFGPAAATSTGVARTYFYGGGGPFASTLYVTSVDLSAFGIANGATIKAVQITSAPQGDLIRVAGFATTTSVPEPTSILMLSCGIFALAGVLRRKR